MDPREDAGAGRGTAGLTAAAMLAFAANSLLCRAALGGGHADAATFTALRLAAGALALAASAIGASFGSIRVDPLGAGLALVSGAVASGMGYALWHAALRRLTAIRAALVQLSVPLLAAGAGMLLLGESLSPRLLAAGTLVLGGIVLAVAGRGR
jgi:drug/metabolite transporter (DMT)-like permease